MTEKIAVYPGSYDPLTNGHIDITERGLEIFDKIIVAALINPNKTYLFTLEERLEMMKNAFESNDRIEVDLQSSRLLSCHCFQRLFSSFPIVRPG